MAWTVTVTKDTKTTGVGFIEAVWENGGESFPFAERSKLDKDSQDTFVLRAIAARDNWILKTTDEVSLADAIKAKLDAADMGG